MILTEDYNLKNGTFVKNDGTRVPIVFIDPKTSDSAYEHKDVLKNQYGASFFGKLKAWGWFIDDESIYKNKVEPALMYLKQKASKSAVESDDLKTKVEGIIDALIEKFRSGDVGEPEKYVQCESKEEVQKRLYSYKRQLMDTISDSKFKEMMEPMLRFRRAQGHQFSITNALLIIMQNPDAIMVKPKTGWARLNREVKNGAHALWAWVPVPIENEPLTDEEKNEIIQKFLSSANVEKVEDLTPGDQEELDIALRNKGDVVFKLKPSFFDLSDTIQIEGKEDLVGDPDASVEWYTEGGEETDKLKKLIQATSEVIKHAGINLSYEDELHGSALGTSSGGRIRLLNSAKKNEGLLNTMIHEFAHELLHQSYLKSNVPEFAEYFVGKEQGRKTVEQQAELTAWIVMKEFGFDMQTSINYVGLWGLDERNAYKVFDSVAKVASRITELISHRYAKLVQEGKSLLSENVLTGEDVANMIGMGDVYKKSKEAAMQMKEQKKVFAEQFSSLIKRMSLNESWNNGDSGYMDYDGYMSKSDPRYYDEKEKTGYYDDDGEEEMEFTDRALKHRNQRFNKEFHDMWEDGEFLHAYPNKDDKVAYRTAYTMYIDQLQRDGRLTNQEADNFYLDIGME